MKKELKIILLFGVLMLGLIILAIFLSFVFLGNSSKSSVSIGNQNIFTKSDELRLAQAVDKLFEGFRHESPLFSYNSIINGDVLMGVKNKGVESLVVSNSRKRKDYSVFVFCRMDDETAFYGSFYLGQKGGILASLIYENDIEIIDEKLIKMYFEFALEILEEVKKDLRYVSLVEEGSYIKKEGPYIQILEKIKKHLKK